MLSAALVAATVGAVAAAAYKGMLREALVAVVALLLIPVFVKRPLILLFAYLLIPTNLFETLPLRSMTALQAGPVALGVPDVLVLLMFVVAVIRLRKRHQRPMFLGFVILWCAYVAFQLMYGHFLLGETSTIQALAMPLAGAGDLVGWVLYLLLLALIDSPRDLRMFGSFFLVIMVVAVVYQLAEYAYGHRLIPFPVGVPLTNYDVDRPLSAGIPYLWSRATYVTMVGLLLAFAAAIDGRRLFVNASLAVAGLISIALTQIRAVYVGVAIAVLAVVVLRGWKARRLVRVLVLASVLVVMAVALTPLVARSFGGDPAGALLARASTLVNYNTEGTWIGRTRSAKRAWDGLKQSPLTGFGWGGRTWNKLAGESGMNVMVVHGFLGTFMILAMYLTVLVKALRLAWRLAPSLERSWLFGLVGVLVGQLAMTPSQDYLISGGFAVTAAVFVDRISAFKADGLLVGSGGQVLSSLPRRGYWRSRGG